MSSEEDQLTQDDVFDILSSARRRYVLYMLKTEGPMELTALAEHVAAWENDTAVEDLSKQQRKRVYVSLYQTHVPKLAESGLVDYDQESGIVEMGTRADTVDRYLETEDDGLAWQYLYLPLAVVGLLVVGLAGANVWVFAMLSQVELAIILSVGILVTAAAHGIVWYTSQREIPTELRR